MPTVWLARRARPSLSWEACTDFNPSVCKIELRALRISGSEAITKISLSFISSSWGTGSEAQPFEVFESAVAENLDAEIAEAAKLFTQLLLIMMRNCV